MDPRYLANIIIFSMFFGSAVVISLGYFWFKRPRGVGDKQLSEISARLANLERAVDAIAVETERISEGQRFTTKLLSERAPERSVAP